MLVKKKKREMLDLLLSPICDAVRANERWSLDWPIDLDEGTTLIDGRLWCPVLMSMCLIVVIGRGLVSSYCRLASPPLGLSCT